ncbi:MAG TPA: archaeosortase/exosortase family protein [Armatimonadaceae bacterium]|nr:archaeosortase/exosortase family protein [Armatimonadaceae bacterium]
MITPRRHFSEDVPSATDTAIAFSPAPPRSGASAADVEAPARPIVVALRHAASGMREFLGFLWTNSAWVLLLGIPYLAAWWLPFYWCFREDRWWARWESAIIYQPFVPLGVAALAWADRKRLSVVWEETKYRYSERRRGGTVLLLVLGCALLFGAHLVHVAAIAVAALILIAAGVVLRQYGGLVLRALSLPLLFFLTMLPPPSSLVSIAEKFFQTGGARAVASLMRGAATVNDKGVPRAVIGGSQVDITPAINGLNVVLLLAAVLLFVGMLRRMRALPTALLMTMGAFLGLLLNFARVIAVALTAGRSPALSEFLHGLNPLLIVLPALLLTFAAERRLQPAVEWAGKRFGGVRRLTTRTDRVTQHLADSAGRTVGKRILKAGSASTTFTERLLRGAERSIRRRRRQRHDASGSGGSGR